MIYLCGPINGCTDEEANDWRSQVKAAVGEENCLDPMRRDYRGREDECYDEIVDLDKIDIAASNVVLAHCWQVSWGTAMEIAIARLWAVPVVAVVEPGARISPWLRYHSVVVDSLDKAIELAKEWCVV